jgi:hypothetical protein
MQIDINSGNQNSPASVYSGAKDLPSNVNWQLLQYIQAPDRYWAPE